MKQAITPNKIWNVPEELGHSIKKEEKYGIQEEKDKREITVHDSNYAL